MKFRKQDGFSNLNAVFVVVALVVIGTVGWFVVQNRFAKPESTSKLTMNEVVTLVKDKVKSDAPEAIETGSEEGNYNGLVIYKVEGYEYLSSVETKTSVNYKLKNPTLYTMDDQAAGAMRKDTIALNPVKATILSVMGDNNFEPVADDSSYPYPSDTKMYQSPTNVCAVNASETTVGVSCASKQELTESAKSVRPFVSALRSASVSEPAGTAFRLIKTGTGSTENDKYAIVSTTIASAYFYQENGNWVYFTNSPEGLECNYTKSNPSAEKAFSQVCRDSLF